MNATAKLSAARISAQKARLVADQIRGKHINEAVEILSFSQKKASGIILKLLNSAIANAENNKGADIDSLYIAEIQVGEGVTMKRFAARAKGRGNRIFKRTSNIFIRVQYMGQKVHPIGFRLGISKDWVSKWYAEGKDYANFLEKDFEVRQFIHKKLSHASVSQIQIERPRNGAQITIFTARPGIVIGRKGEDIEILKKEISALMGVPTSVNIEEIRRPELDAYLVADGIAKQLERRVMFRRAMKRSVASTMRLGAAGIKISISGRLNGAEIARTEWYREGRVPLHTLRADIDYGFAEAHTTYGVIGVKVWIFKGENLEGFEKSANNIEVPEDKRARRNNKTRNSRRKD